MKSLQEVQDEQGYVIFAYRNPVEVGHVAERVLDTRDNGIIDAQVIAIAPATIGEWREQCLKYGSPWDEDLARRYPCLMKCVAE